MIERALFLVTIAGGAALGVFWPLSKEAPSDAASAALEVTLDRNSDKHFYADATVNGRPVRFLVDTGSSEIALTETDAKRVGIAIDPSKYELLGQGASGIVRGQYIEIDKIEVGGISGEATKAVVVQGANVSLLGQPFLENLDEIVIRKSEMTLKSSQHS